MGHAMHGMGGMRAGDMATEAGGTHATGRHSCHTCLWSNYCDYNARNDSRNRPCM